MKGWNRTCSSVGNTVGSLPEYVVSQSLSEEEKREQKKLSLEEKMLISTMEYLEQAIKGDAQELAIQEDKTSSNALDVRKRIEENEQKLKEIKIQLADVAFRMSHIRDKSVSQVFTNVATVTQDATNTVVNSEL